jgi:GntR family transcriptional regulator
MNVFLIQTNSDVPIYRQLVDQVRRLSASGRLKKGDGLPSVRQLAAELAINPMTISKAYSLLESEGVLERRRGVGMVMRDAGPESEDLIEPAIIDLVTQAKQLGLTKTTVVGRIKATWEQLDD